MISAHLRCGIIALAVIAAWPVRAQDGHHGIGHAQHHDWYKELKQPSRPGWSCCTREDGTQGDCRPVRAYWDDFAERWMAHVDGRWEPVPPQVIIKDDSLNKEPFTAHACKSKAGIWFCFLRKSAGG